MPNTSTDYETLLRQLIEELVAEIRYANGFLFALLKEATVGKEAVMELDGIRLHLSADSAGDYTLQLRRPLPGEAPTFISSGDVLRDIVDGALTLDRALAANRVYVRGPLADLLGIYRLTIGLLAEGPVDPHLRRLWTTFDEAWITSRTFDAMLSLDEQQVHHFFPFQGVPAEVALIMIDY